MVFMAKKKKIAILSCLEATKVCTGYGCLNAFNNKIRNFESYTEELELLAFFYCNGCDADYENDEGYKEKIEKIISLNPDFIHVGVCCKTKNNGEYCSTVKNMIKYFEHHNITIIDGTH